MSGFSRTSRHFRRSVRLQPDLVVAARPWHSICPSRNVITGKPERLKTFDYLGPHRCFLTFCTFERRHMFLTRERTEAVHEQFLRASVDEGFAVLAYCFMPDHLHLLVEAQATDSDCRRFITRATIAIDRSG